MNRIDDYLLIGNSRLHWASSNNSTLHFSHTKFDESIPEHIDTQKLIWASVGKYPTNNFLKRNEVTINDLNLKNFANHIGIDRGLACLAALKKIDNKSKKNILIVDLGTTVSITKIDYEGTMIGGQIFAGFTNQLKSMEQSTKNLKYPDELYIPHNKFELSTMNALLRGVYNSIFGAIYLSFNRDEDILVLCGGDSNLIGNSVKKEIIDLIIEPDLVMYGMVLLNNKDSKINST